MDIAEREKKRRNYALYWIIRSSTISAIATYYYEYIYKEPCMTSLQIGQDWINEILNGHTVRCMLAFRMDRTLFTQLCEELQSKYGLQSSKRTTVVEKVCIFVYTLAMGAFNRDVRKRFQHSGETISRAFHEVLEAISGRNRGYQGLARDIIRPKDPTFQYVPPHIANDERYMPYFKYCIGCIDGITACIPEAEQMRYRGRKGITTFNVMASCDFDMCFTFISIGWEGSAHDTRRYYLVDKAYHDKEGYLVRYPKIKYHLSQFEYESPTNAQEAFNREHSSLRSSFALHNYIRINSHDDPMFTVLDQHPNYVPHDDLSDSVVGPQGGDILEGETGRSIKTKEIRNNIAALI
ncbi:uncharacterized protein LOC131644069 [Vicia villosa]|uniref:uncharacterized protein LOC131644069 n=1 Tax=Vicia villosa TaxID=3911 RepID=UPI00273B90BA|nr:uncharacterized protein LOC131644069 [Vicia villosa]